MPHGKICYLEIPANTAEASADFYSTIFGWKVRQRGDGELAFDVAGGVSGTWVKESDRTPDERTRTLAILHTVACGWRAQVAGTRGLRHRIQCNGQAITDYAGTRSPSMKAAATRRSSHIMVVCFKILSSRSSLSRFTSSGTGGGEGRDEGNSRRQWCIRRSCRELQVLAPPSNTRLKLPAPVVCGRIAFVNLRVWRRSLGAIR